MPLLPLPSIDDDNDDCCCCGCGCYCCCCCCCCCCCTQVIWPTNESMFNRTIAAWFGATDAPHVIAHYPPDPLITPAYLNASSNYAPQMYRRCLYYHKLV